jgi:hypothetical protein
MHPVEHASPDTRGLRCNVQESVSPRGCARTRTPSCKCFHANQHALCLLRGCTMQQDISRLTSMHCRVLLCVEHKAETTEDCKWFCLHPIEHAAPAMRASEPQTCRKVCRHVAVHVHVTLAADAFMQNQQACLSKTRRGHRHITRQHEHVRTPVQIASIAEQPRFSSQS